MPHELISLLEAEGIHNVILTGAKASGSVQAACQLLIDKCMDVSIVRDCVQDDNTERLEATLDHLLPIYGNVLTLKELVDDIGGLEILSSESKSSLVDLMSGGTGGKAASLPILLSFCTSSCSRCCFSSTFVPQAY